jgi:polyisoprenoid-binding protein YceI
MPLQGARRIGASATGKLRRSDFGITFNKVLEAGGVALGDKVSLSVDVSLVEGGRR